jgi:hypothetical protein
MGESPARNEAPGFQKSKGSRSTRSGRRKSRGPQLLTGSVAARSEGPEKFLSVFWKIPGTLLV